MAHFVLPRFNAWQGVDTVQWLWFLIIGVLAGWLAGLLVRGGGFGLLGDLVVGILGALVGGFLFRLLGVFPGNGIEGALITSLVGAIALLLLFRLFRRA